MTFPTPSQARSKALSMPGLICMRSNTLNTSGPPVHVDRLAGEEGRLVGRDEQHRRGDLVRPAEAAQAGEDLVALVLLGRQLGRLLGLLDPRRHHVAPAATQPQLLAQR